MRSIAPRGQLRPIRSTDRSGKIPLSFAQQRLWFLAQMKGASEAYHIALCKRLRGNLDRSALRQALDRVLARHESLRTTFSVVDSQLVQHIASHDEGSFHLVEHDLRLQHDTPAELERLMAEEIQNPFNLELGPLIRGLLIRLKDDEHALLITMHHIVSDGWSMNLLMRELSALYGAFLRHEEDPLPGLEIQYGDYAVWQRQCSGGEALERQAEYWKNMLAGAPTILDLPMDRSRPAEQSFAGSSVEVELDPALTAALKAFGRRHRTTLYATLLTAWAILLARLSGQQEVVVGAPIANRSLSQLESLIGFFVNTLALRASVPSSITVKELLSQVSERIIAAQQHQDIPFEHVVELVQPVRSLAYTPLFQVVFSWQKTIKGVSELPGLTLEPLNPPRLRATPFDLTLWLSDSGDRVFGGLDYATALFDQETIKRFLNYFHRLLASMVSDEHQLVHRLPMLPETEQREIVEKWHHRNGNSANRKCIHQLFEEQAAIAPNAVAVACEQSELTYGELNRRANRLARYLLELGVGPDSRVAICLERGFEMIIALLAVLKAGGAYVPLDPAYPAERLRFMIEDCAPAAVIAHSHLAGQFAASGSGFRLIDIDRDSECWNTLPDTSLDVHSPNLDTRNLAYIIYTSGSTGAPKGVMVQHANVVRLFAATQDWFQFNASDVWSLFHSYAFDFSVWEIWGALLYGGRIVVVLSDTVRSPEDFYALLCRERVTVLNQTPSAFRQLIASQATSRDVHSLRLVIFGGEALEVATLKPWYEDARNRHAGLVNMYGITETTVHVTYRPLVEADCDRSGGSPFVVSHLHDGIHFRVPAGPAHPRESLESCMWVEQGSPGVI